jgi:hypothetical protein
MEKVNIDGKMVENISGVITKIIKMVLEYIIGLMVADLKVSGKMENEMVLEK